MQLHQEIIQKKRGIAVQIKILILPLKSITRKMNDKAARNYFINSNISGKVI